jgi:uncharacterized protein (AIM24 family)
VQHHPADELHVEVALAQRAPRRLAHGSEGGDEQIIERNPAFLQLAAEVSVRLELKSLKDLISGSSALMASTRGR